jgi:hypothetical protein
MKNVDPSILKSLYDTDKEFFKENGINKEKVKKYYYDEKIIKKLNTSDLEKYKDIKNLNDKITKFLKQKILYVWEWEISNF